MQQNMRLGFQHFTTCSAMHEARSPPFIKDISTILICMRVEGGFPSRKHEVGIPITYSHFCNFNVDFDSHLDSEGYIPIEEEPSLDPYEEE